LDYVGHVDLESTSLKRVNLVADYVDLVLQLEHQMLSQLMNVEKNVLMAKNWVLMVTVNLAWLELTEPKVFTWLVKDVQMVSQHQLLVPPMLVTVPCLFVRWVHTSIPHSTNVSCVLKANTKINKNTKFNASAEWDEFYGGGEDEWTAEEWAEWEKQEAAKWESQQQAKKSGTPSSTPASGGAKAKAKAKASASSSAGPMWEDDFPSLG